MIAAAVPRKSRTILERNGLAADAKGLLYLLQQFSAAAGGHFYHGDAQNIVVLQNVAEFRRNIIIRIRAADQKDLSGSAAVVKAGVGKSAAVGGDQQMRPVILGRDLRCLPELQGPLDRRAFLSPEGSGIEAVKFLPGILHFAHGHILSAVGFTARSINMGVWP